jgi:hypothetical protein
MTVDNCFIVCVDTPPEWSPCFLIKITSCLLGNNRHLPPEKSTCKGAGEIPHIPYINTRIQMQ